MCKANKILLFIFSAIVLTLFASWLLDDDDIIKGEASFVHANERNRSYIDVYIITGHGSFIDNIYQTQGKQSPQWLDGLKIYEGYSCKMLGYELVDELLKNDIDAALVNPKAYDIDLVERVNMINEALHFNRRIIVISLHHNAQPTDKADYTDKYGQKGYYNCGATGVEIYTTPDKTKSDTIATLIFNSMKKELPQLNYRTDNSDGDPDKEAWFYELRKTGCPAVLIEFLFMTTYSDCLLIANDTIREKYVKSVTNGLIEYNNSFKK